MRLVAGPVDEAGFARYGTLVPLPVSTGRLPLDGLFQCDDPDGTLRASMTRLDPTPLPTLLPRMERHPHAVQLFVPVAVRRYLAVTALGEHAPEMDTLSAFVVPGDVGIAYGIGIWHVPMMVLDAPGTFMVLMQRLTAEQDEEWHSLAEPIEVAGL